MFDSIRTRHLPLFFAVAGLLLATLFLLFYRLVFQAIDLAFEQQNLASHASIVPHLQKSRQTLVRQARILHVSRGIRRQFAGETDHVILAKSLDVFARRWFERTKNPSIRGVSYLDASRNPIVGIDFQQDEQVVDLGQLADVVPETAAATGPNVIRGSLTALPRVRWTCILPHWPIRRWFCAPSSTSPTGARRHCSDTSSSTSLWKT